MNGHELRVEISSLWFQITAQSPCYCVTVQSPCYCYQTQCVGSLDCEILTIEDCAKDRGEEVLRWA